MAGVHRVGSTTTEQVGLAEVLAPLEARGREAYLGEPLTVTEHSLQAALAAELDGAPPGLVVAALLHDVGWLLPNGPRTHEARGAAFLRRLFGPAVTEPVRLHVTAKRYLCTIDPGYRAALAADSRRTLGRQGGLLDEDAREAFADDPYAGDALRLRRYDDAAKVPGAATPPLEHFATLVAAELVGELVDDRRGAPAATGDGGDRPLPRQADDTKAEMSGTPRPVT